MTQATIHRILEAYLEVCLKEGVAAATLQKIAKRSKLAIGTLQYHFGSGGETTIEEAALRYVVKGSQEFVEARMAKARASRDFRVLETYAAATLEWAAEKPAQVSYSVHAFYLGSVSAPLSPAVRELMEGARSRVLGFVFEDFGRGVYPAARPSPELALTLHTLILGATIVVSMNNADAKKVKLIIEQTRAGIAALLGGNTP